MHTPSGLLDIHERSHRTLQGLLRHCALLTGEEFHRELPVFGDPTVQAQLDHVIGAEEYWVSVVRGLYQDNPPEVVHDTMEELTAYRERVAAVTQEYLRQADEVELNTAREMRTYPGRMRSLVPAHVLLRVMVHIYQHQGKVMAMCRQIGKPGPAGLDFPLD